MIVKLTSNTGQTVDISRRIVTIQWSGDDGQLARELSITLAVSATDPDYAALDVGLFRPIGLYQDDGSLLMSGYVVKVSRDSDSDTMEISAMDRGLWLANNQGWYSFPGTTPEDATRTLCGDFGISVGVLPATEISIKRKFPGVALHDILQTIWYLAGEQTGKRYHACFVGTALTVQEKPLTASKVLAPQINLHNSSITRDGTGYHNTVIIYSDEGKRLRSIQSETANFALEGFMQAILTQAEGEDAEKEARATLLDDDIKQTVTVTCEGDLSLLTGQAVQVRLTSAGVMGLFWIESDTHTWKDGQYTTKLSLNFRNIMKEFHAGTDWEESKTSGSSKGATDTTFSTLLQEAEKYLGYPYVWGGSTPASSFDCSGFVSWVFRASGVYPLKRSTAQGIYNQCSKISSNAAQPGDLVFFTKTYNSGHPVSHLGIYVGGGRMIHAGKKIQYTDLNTAYWKNHFYAFGRLPIA